MATLDTAADDTLSLEGSKLDWKAVGAVALGNMLEFYDFITFSFFAVDIGRAFFPSKDPTTSLLSSLAVFWSGFLMRPLGGVVIGALADRAGRKPAMVLTIGLMALGMLMLAATPSVATIGIAAPIIVIAGRLIQGFALGGEVGPSTAYLLEAAPQKRRAFFASWQTASQGVAAILAGLISLALSLSLSKVALESWGWRVPFFLGIAIVPVGIVIRSHLPETAGEGQDPDAAHSTMGVLRLLVAEHGRRLLLTLLVIMAATISFYIGANMPTYAQSSLKFTKAASDGVTLALGFASLGFTLLGGWLADRYGRRPSHGDPARRARCRRDPGVLARGAPAAPGHDLRRGDPALGPVVDLDGGDHRGRAGGAAAQRPLGRAVHHLRALGLAVRRFGAVARDQADRADRRQGGAGLLPRRDEPDRRRRRLHAAGDARP